MIDTEELECRNCGYKFEVNNPEKKRIKVKCPVCKSDLEWFFEDGKAMSSCYPPGPHYYSRFIGFWMVLSSVLPLVFYSPSDFKWKWGAFILLVGAILSYRGHIKYTEYKHSEKMRRQYKQEQ
ncbi:hypothetical protein [Maridesulfovibrio bastinii]|uniref:hypothetical protein n=1 Tax=Maridesulfovibrio bastinii TaxID=47157 RepID=UPI000483F975|nr:hypothetical protein [Maridesulfovibrio bastinii]